MAAVRAKRAARWRSAAEAALRRRERYVRTDGMEPDDRARQEPLLPTGDAGLSSNGNKTVVASAVLRLAGPQSRGKIGGGSAVAPGSARDPMVRDACPHPEQSPHP